MMLPETTEQLAALQRKDPTWRKVMENIEMFAQFTMRQGVLFHEEARCLPQDKEFMAKVLHDAHDTNGHMGISKSYDVMSKQWYRPGMLNILTAYVNSCVICKGAKKSRQRPSGRMHPQRNLTALAFDNIALDIFSLPLSDGYDACRTIMDTSTKMVILQPTRSTASTEDVAEMLFTSVICKGFLPSTIITDRDPKYTSGLWAAVMKKLGTKIQLTTPYHWHQQADPAERTIQTVQSVLRCYNGVDWVKRLLYVELALNEALNDSTGFATHDLLYIARKGPVADRFAETDSYENAPELLAQAKHRIREAMANIKLAKGNRSLITTNDIANWTTQKSETMRLSCSTNTKSATLSTTSLPGQNGDLLKYSPSVIRKLTWRSLPLRENTLPSAVSISRYFRQTNSTELCRSQSSSTGRRRGKWSV
jgi:translation initiation factor 2 beta subunit (eIF-2beta)/eIF-5